MWTEEDVLRTMNEAISRIALYIPEYYEIDDCGWGDGCFQFGVFDCRECGEMACDMFHFFYHENETEKENMDRLNESIQRFIKSIRRG